MDAASPSPLWMLTKEPLTNQLVSYLAQRRVAILSQPDVRHTLSFSVAELRRTRAEFSTMICRGEARLHTLCKRLGTALFLGDYDMRSVVIGEVPTTGKRFEYTQRIHLDTLFQETDLDLGNRLLAQLQYHDDRKWVTPRLIANFVEYQPLIENRHGIHKMISRIKAEEEIWHKVCDEIFRVDELIARDKHLRRYSRYVKDVFGIKCVVGTPHDARTLQTHLEALTWPSEEPNQDAESLNGPTHRLNFIEVKDYLGPTGRKQSGWEAIKSVVEWGGGMFELQLQPLANYFMERERLTRESHYAFKQNRERLRNQLAENNPLMGFYRDLLQWLFLDTRSPPPKFKGVEVVVNA